MHTVNETHNASAHPKFESSIRLIDMVPPNSVRSAIGNLALLNV